VVESIARFAPLPPVVRQSADGYLAVLRQLVEEGAIVPPVSNLDAEAYMGMGDFLFSYNLLNSPGFSNEARLPRLHTVEEEKTVVYDRAAAPKGAMGGFGYDYFDDHFVGSPPALLKRTGLWGGGAEYAYEALNLVDGRRTVSEIRDALAAIYGPLPLTEVAEYLGDLEKIHVLQHGRASHAP
jgi:hypothetical protein